MEQPESLPLTKINFANMLTKVYPVTGMSCANCALNVEKTLKRQPGIANASVNFADSSVLIEFKSDQAEALPLQSALRSAGYDLVVEEQSSEKAEEDHIARFKALRARTIFAIVLSVPVMIISMFFMNPSAGMAGISFANLIMLVLTLPVLLWSGQVFYVNAVKQARHGNANMDTLVAMSTGIAFLFSLFNTFFPQFWHLRGLHPHVYYEASAVIIAFILVGKLLEERAKSNTSSAIKKLMGLRPSVVILVNENGQEKPVPAHQVKKGDRVRVKPGDKIPVDGELLSGNSFIDESTMTGESIPMEKAAGDKVFSGTLNLNGSFIMTAQQVGSETMLSRIIETVRLAQGSKAPVQKIVDRIAGVFVPVVIGISLLSFTLWMIFGENALPHALMAMVTVLVIACPCALGLATPTAIMVGMGKGAQNGILIKDAESLEKIHKVNAIILDKTGTITEGKPAVIGIEWYIPSREQQAAEKILFALENHSSHPLANAVTSYLSTIKNDPVTGDQFENLSGMGIRARLGEKIYLAGNKKLMDKQGVEIPQNKLAEDKQSAEAKTMIFFACNSSLLATIFLADKIRASSHQAIKNLQNQGIEVHMLTGDNWQTAKDVADKTGISRFSANFLPEDKAAYVRQLQAENKTVAMAGDGINDSQALAEADVSIAMGKGSDIAMDVAGMTLVTSDLRQIEKAIRLSKLTVKTIHQNLFWAFIYNVIGIPVAAGALYPLWGFMLNPMIAAAAMAMSSVSVVSNSLRLRGKKI
jgi:P-type Cu2+ transporter